MQTPLTSLLRIRVPLVCSPMAGAAGGRLAAAVTLGGGLGMIAGGHMPLQNLVDELHIARQLLQPSSPSPLPPHTAGGKLPEILQVGIGLIAWRIESPQPVELAESFLRTIVQARPRAVWLSFGLELERWVKRVRELEKEIWGEVGERIVVFIMVGTTEHAVQVASFADVVVAQGIEAGGHGLSQGSPLLTLLPTIQRAYASLPSPPLLLGAGGLATGAHLVSLLPFSSGIVLGTSFLATPESLYSPAQKELILKAKGEETVRTLTFDYCRGTLGFPVEVNGRAIANLTSGEGGHGARGSEQWTEELREKFKAGVEKGSVDRMVTWAGTSVGLIDKITPAADLVREIEAEALATLDHLLALRQSS